MLPYFPPPSVPLPLCSCSVPPCFTVPLLPAECMPFLYLTTHFKYFAHFCYIIHSAEQYSIRYIHVLYNYMYNSSHFSEGLKGPCQVMINQRFEYLRTLQSSLTGSRNSACFGFCMVFISTHESSKHVNIHHWHANKILYPISFADSTSH